MKPTLEIRFSDSDPSSAYLYVDGPTAFPIVGVEIEYQPHPSDLLPTGALRFGGREIPDRYVVRFPVDDVDLAVRSFSADPEEGIPR